MQQTSQPSYVSAQGITAIHKTDAPPQLAHHKNFLLTSALGGAAALLMEGLLHPIDTIRTRIKSKTKTYAPFFQYAKRMYRREGVKSYFRGFSSTLYGSFVSNASYFYVYEKCKYELENSKLVPRDMGPFIAGFVGGFMSDFLKLPFDVIRTRMQLKPGHYDYVDCLDGARKIVSHEGVKALYLGAPAFFTLSASTTSLTFGLYEIFYRMFKPIFPKGEGANLPLSTCSSACAASLAAIITNPLDVIVTRIESIDTASKKDYGTIEIAKSIYKKEGPMGFMKGVTGTVVYYSMSAVILFPTYEVLRVIFNVDLSV